MICSKCSAEMPEISAYCPVCGHPVNPASDSFQANDFTDSLLAAVAYADRDYSQTEEQFVRQLLGRVEGMTDASVDAICAAMRRHVVEVSTVKIPHYTRELRWRSFLDCSFSFFPLFRMAGL